MCHGCSIVRERDAQVDSEPCIIEEIRYLKVIFSEEARWKRETFEVGVPRSKARENIFGGRGSQE